MTTPTRLRNWATLVRGTGGEVAHPEFCERLTKLLEGCATREDAYQARIAELEARRERTAARHDDPHADDEPDRGPLSPCCDT
jgi:hypothetical protein